MNMQHSNMIQQRQHDTKSQKSKKKGLKKLFGFGGRRRKSKHSSAASVDIDGESYFDVTDAATAPVTTPTSPPHIQRQRSPQAQQQQQQAWMSKQTSSGSRGVAARNQQQQQTSKSKSPPPPVMPKSWLAKTKFFQNLIENSFESIDADGSGDIDEKELYSGLLLIHLQLGAYAGPAACKPISREKCHSVFLKMDVDGSGRLDKNEFSQVMMVLFGNVMLRVVFQYAATLMVVPILAQYILSTLNWLLFELIPFLWNHYIDQHTSIDEFFEDNFVMVQTKIIEITKRPETFLLIRNTVQDIFDKIPDSVWSTIPLTLVSTILSMMIVPWTLMKIDDFFQAVASYGGGSGSGNGKNKK